MPKSSAKNASSPLPIDEGYIKYESVHRDAAPLADEFLFTIKRYRQKLYALGLIGIYPDGIGYGNISVRTINNEFVISGSATGGHSEIASHHFCTVTACDVKNNRVFSEGPLQASSESMTHYVLYAQDQTIGAVIHIHSLPAWQKLCGNVPTTSAEVPYGTPQMAYEIERLYAESTLSKDKILAMAGHTEGIITFGTDLDEAFVTLMRNL